MRAGLLGLLLLAACEGDRAEPVGIVSGPETAAAAEAERVCAQITGVGERDQAGSAIRRREYRDCVEAVAGEPARGKGAPVLRGRS